MKISFVEANPEIFEYPSETSLMDDSIPPSSNGSSVGHNVPPLTGNETRRKHNRKFRHPNFSGSSLANYTPKTGVAAEDFQLGVTRAAPVAALRSEVEERTVLEEVEQPMLFSAGTNSDILFWTFQGAFLFFRCVFTRFLICHFSHNWKAASFDTKARLYSLLQFLFLIIAGALSCKMTSI